MRRPCDVCRRPYEAVRANSRYCSDTCSKRARRGAGQTDTPAGVSVEQATRVALAEYERVDTWQGQTALALAKQLDEGHDTGAAKAQLAKQLAASMEVALSGVAVVDDPLDELRTMRDRRRASAG